MHHADSVQSGNLGKIGPDSVPAPYEQVIRGVYGAENHLDQRMFFFHFGMRDLLESQDFLRCPVFFEKQRFLNLSEAREQDDIIW